MTLIIVLLIIAALVRLLITAHIRERRQVERLENLCRAISILNPDAPDYDEWKKEQGRK